LTSTSLHRLAKDDRTSCCQFEMNTPWMVTSEAVTGVRSGGSVTVRVVAAAGW
jgi:hypothetical protein